MKTPFHFLSGWRAKTLFTSSLFLLLSALASSLSHRKSRVVHFPCPCHAHLMRLTGLEHSNHQTWASNAYTRHGVLFTGNMSETRRFTKRHGSRLPKETQDGGSEPLHQGRLSSELQNFSRVKSGCAMCLRVRNPSETPDALWVCHVSRGNTCLG